jgi:integrase
MSNIACDAILSRKFQSRERVLTDEELKVVFRTAFEGNDSFSFIVALLILTGQRRTEIGSLRPSWLNKADSTITLPSGITKNKRTHVFPYGSLAASIIERIPDTHDTYLFPASRDHVRGKPTTSFNGWSKAKETFDRKCSISDWTLHDLRRTFASNLAALGVSLPTIEKLLNHVSGSFGGIVAVYQRHNWMPEMRTAIVAWENRLAACISHCK